MWDDFLTTSDYKKKLDFLKHRNKDEDDLKINLLILKKRLIC